MRSLFVCLLLIFACALAETVPQRSPYDSVDPFIGTASEGNTFPAATLPFGMIQWGPDTRADGWYRYPDKTIRGFSLTHISGAGCPIFADVPILPWIEELKKSGPSQDYVLQFSHDHEQAQPGYYAVEFENHVKVGLTVAERAGIARFLFPTGAARTLLIKASESATIDNEKRKADSSSVEVRGNDSVVGVVHSGGFCESDTHYVLYFVLKFAAPFSTFGTWTDSLSPGAISATGHKAGAYVSFSSGAAPVIVKVGLSFVSLENAAANLQSEIPAWDFDAVHAAAKSKWTSALGHIDAQGTPDQRTNFYTGLYHMLLSPNIFSDANGDYIGFDGKVRHLAHNQAQYANFSDWDIYRNNIQFYSLLFPRQTSQMMQSLVRDAEQSGWLPRWPVANDVSYVMGGDSSAMLLSSAYAFGARSFDTKSALQYMLKGATQPGVGLHGNSQRPGLSEYISKGYVPVGAGNETGASITLEYASADFAISRFAAAMGDRSSAEKLLCSSQNWRNLFDKESAFIRPRTADGKFIGDWDPDRLTPHHTGWDHADQLGFEEGSTWQYTWVIPHNYAGLFQAIGGNQKVLPVLDRFFQNLSGWGVPTFTVTNEPDFCAPYAYLWTGNAWKTQQVIDRIRRETFFPKPDGLPGNDDLGATSGVYVWNALGMYPVIPGVAGLVLGTPMFQRSTMHLGNGSTLEIISHGEGIYVQSLSLNGKPYTSAWLPLTALTAIQNRLEFTLGPQSNRTWAAATTDLPPSFDVRGAGLQH